MYEGLHQRSTKIGFHFTLTLYFSCYYSPTLANVHNSFKGKVIRVIHSANNSRKSSVNLEWLAETCCKAKKVKLSL
jgi:hypothetical protein